MLLGSSAGVGANGQWGGQIRRDCYMLGGDAFQLFRFSRKKTHPPDNSPLWQLRVGYGLEGQYLLRRQWAIVCFIALLHPRCRSAF